MPFSFFRAEYIEAQRNVTTQLMIYTIPQPELTTLFKNICSLNFINI